MTQGPGLSTSCHVRPTQEGPDGEGKGGTAKSAEKRFLPPSNVGARASQQDPGPAWAAVCPLRLSLSPCTGDKCLCFLTPLTTATVPVYRAGGGGQA